MGTATVVQAAKEVAFRSAAELREVMDRLLEMVDRDERIGPLFRARQPRTRFEFTDFDLAANVASRLDDPDHCLSWSFAKRAPWPPKLVLVMSSATANSYLQGKLSLPVAVARGLVRVTADSRAALLFLPAARLLVRPYSELLESEYPHLLIT